MKILIKMYNVFLKKTKTNFAAISEQSNVFQKL